LEQLKQLTSNRLAADVGAKFIAGFFASFLSLPFDFVKTRMQKQKPGPDGKLPYANVASAFAKILAAVSLAASSNDPLSHQCCLPGICVADFVVGIGVFVSAHRRDRVRSTAVS